MNELRLMLVFCQSNHYWELVVVFFDAHTSDPLKGTFT